MSATETVETPTATLVRTFEATLSEGDGRTIDARIVPYNVPTTVVDPPDRVPYRELFVPGAFERQLSAADRVKVWLNFEHEPGLRGIVGHGVSLSEHDDALYGSFRVHENVDGDKALGLVREGLLTGLSIEFAALRSRAVDGVVQRLRAHIDKVSLCRFPAYSDARVLGLREQGDEEQEADVADPPAPSPTPAEKPRSVPLAPDLADRLEALGFTPLLRIATTSKPWDGSPSRFDDDQYRRSTLFCRGGEGVPPKQDCSLPVLEPDGTLNTNALGPAAAALAGARGGVRNASSATKAAAARKLIRLYNAAGMEPPPSLRALASSS